MARIIDGNSTNITGNRIKEARIKHGITQKSLSDRLEEKAIYVCRGSISRIESGERTVTDIEVDAIADVLDVSLDYLFGKADTIKKSRSP